MFFHTRVTEHTRAVFFSFAFGFCFGVHQSAEHHHLVLTHKDYIAYEALESAKRARDPWEVVHDG